jgi:hypothetical protein
MSARDQSGSSRLLTAIGVLLIVVPGWLYIQDVPLWEEFRIKDGSTRDPVAAFTRTQGEVRRRTLSSAFFDRVDLGASAFSKDTITTGENSTAVLRFTGGSEIEISSNSLVVIDDELGLSFGGLLRRAKIEIVRGKVAAVNRGPRVTVITEGKRKALATPEPVAATPEPTRVPEATPTPSPSPTPTPVPIAPLTLVRFEPKVGAKFQAAKGSSDPKAEVSFSWELSRLPEEGEKQAELVIVQGEKKIAEREVTLSAISGKVSVTLEQAGKFAWKIILADNREVTGNPAEKNFTVDSLYPGVEGHEILVGDTKLSDNRYVRSDKSAFSITLLWDAVKNSHGYQIGFFSDPELRKPIMSKESKEPKLSLNQAKVFSGRFFYRVLARMPGGFSMVSEPQPFRFDFLPPRLQIPDRGAKVRPKAGEGEILFTWERTRFTKLYALQIAADSKFTKIISSRKELGNFCAITGLKPGTYWWRVQSLEGETPGSRQSSFSAPFSFTVLP